MQKGEIDAEADHGEHHEHHHRRDDRKFQRRYTALAVPEPANGPGVAPVPQPAQDRSPDKAVSNSFYKKRCIELPDAHVESPVDQIIASQ
jgi:hypothetical protein